MNVIRRILLCAILWMSILSLGVFAQTGSTECKGLSLGARVVEYVKNNGLVRKSDAVRVLRIAPTGTRGICLVELEYYFAENRRVKNTQTVHISTDGRFLYPRFIDLSLNVRENLLKAIRVEGFPASGVREAPILIVEYADFQCPPCRLSGLVIREAIQKKYADKILWVYKWLPSSAHDWAREAAVASICVFSQSPSRFWELHNLLLSQQQAISKQSLTPLVLNFTSRAGLNMKDFNGCMAGNADVTKFLEVARIEAAVLGVSATPTIFINGKQARNATDLQGLEELIGQELGRIKPMQDPK